MMGNACEAELGAQRGWSFIFFLLSSSLHLFLPPSLPPLLLFFFSKLLDLYKRYSLKKKFNSEKFKEETKKAKATQTLASHKNH